MAKPKATALKVESRADSGKGASRALRREGYVPGVVYGDKKAPTLFAIPEKDLVKEMRAAGFRTRRFELDIAGDKHTAICQGVEIHPVTDRPIHIDFLRISKDSKLHIDVPVRFVNEEASPGLKFGGVLNIVERTIEVICSSDNIPEHIEVDLTGLEINDTVTISAIKLPAGVVPADQTDFTIAAIAPPMSAEVEVKPEGEAAEGAAATDAKAKPDAKAGAAKTDAKTPAAKPAAKK